MRTREEIDRELDGIRDDLNQPDETCSNLKMNLVVELLMDIREEIQKLHDKS